MKRSEFAQVSKAVIATLIDMGLPLRQDSNDELVAQVCRENEYWSDVRAVLCVDPQSRWSEDARIDITSDNSWDRKTDEETGDVLTTAKVKVNLRLSSFDGPPSDELYGRLDLTRKAVEAAERLSKEFAKEYTYVVRTKEEEAARLAKEEAENRRLKVQRMAEYPSKGLRAGGNARNVSRELFTGCPDGVYEVDYDGGKRQCRVTLRPSSATIRRLG